MEEIIIKPHHFMDIIKLYGSGINEFVPDLKMQHDFYKIANEIIINPTVQLKLTVDGDDICKPCIKYRGECKDFLNHIPGFTRKNVYNRTLDQRIINLYQLDHSCYSGYELCLLLLKQKGNIFKVWIEEDDKVTQRRYELFVKGAEKLLKLSMKSGE